MILENDGTASIAIDGTENIDKYGTDSNCERL